MIEPEMSFCDLAGDMDVAEAMVKYIIDYVMESCKEEIEFLNNFVDKGLIERLKNVSESEFVRLTYTEAISILEKVKDKFEFPVYWGCDLQSEHERYLTEQVYKKPVFLTDYPKEIKAFYMRLNDDNKTVAAADLLVPGIGELIGGSQREEREDVLLARMKELGLNPRRLRILYQSAQVRRHDPFGLRSGLRAHDHVLDGHFQHPRRSALSENGGKSGILTKSAPRTVFAGRSSQFAKYRKGSLEYDKDHRRCNGRRQRARRNRKGRSAGPFPRTKR